MLRVGPAVVGTTGRMQLSPRKTIVAISSEADGCQEVVGSSSEAVLNQRTDDRILEMFSTGLMSWEGGGLEPDACQSSLQLGFRIQGRRAEAGERGRGRHSWTCSSASASIFEAFESAGGSVTGRNVWVAVSGHGQTGVCGREQPACCGASLTGASSEALHYDSLAAAEELLKSMCSSRRPSASPPGALSEIENDVGHLAIVS